jgi:hypothetical protein
MSDDAGRSHEAGDAFPPGADPFTKMWEDFASRMGAAGMAFAPEGPLSNASRQARTAMFKAMSEACDEFMRAPQFQDMMEQSLSASIQFRKQLNDFLGRMHHEFQGTSRQDVDQLMEVIGHVERRITDSVERLSSRVDNLSARLERMEQSKPTGRKAGPRRRGARK